ncbi:hypothetical protein C1645_747411 [Glomus cerebriforme]|uniref:Uncharacterized protein n=1 Tax=Glomus cerebriforme TaxID=658196 RepID=A0A397TPF5_9GLOM|nr:hypothetical protein C1645_747411 [Glomus cerebriforme]
MLNYKAVSPLQHQNTKRFSLKKTIPIFIILGLLICYKYLIEFTYEETSVPTISTVPTVPTIPPIEEDDIDPLSTNEPEYKFRVNLDELKTEYQVMDIIRIVIEPRHPSLVNKIRSTFFRVLITGPTIFSPQLVSSLNSSVLVYEAPLMDQGNYKLQARIIFYDYKEIYNFETSDIIIMDKKSPKVNKLDRIIINGEFTFKVTQSSVWDRLKLALPESCSDISILRGRWKKNFKEFIPYNCIIPKFKKSEIFNQLETNNRYPKFIDYNNLPFRYTWIRFLGDSNTRRLFGKIRVKLGASCISKSDGQNRDKITQYFCTANYTQTSFLGTKDPRPREIYLTYEWYYPGSRYSLETLLNNTFKQSCELIDKCVKKIPCDFVNSTNSSSTNNICSTQKADYTFVSIGSHTPGWNIEHVDKYLENIFNYIYERYQEKITFITTNVVNINKIPRGYRNQYLIRNNFRIAKANELLKKHVDKSQQDNNNKNIDLLDFFGITQPIWEYSSDAVHYEDPVYEEQFRLVFDRLISYIKTIQ